MAPAAPCAPIVSASVTPLGVVLAAEAGARGPRGPLGVDFLARPRERLTDAAARRTALRDDGVVIHDEVGVGCCGSQRAS